MVSLTTQKDFRQVQRLPFCYLCSADFVSGDLKNRDHIPPQSVIAAQDRQPLWLPTHVRCNNSHRLNDEKVGQLIALRYGKVARPEVQRLQFVFSPNGQNGALANLDIDGTVWRWIGGFHAALYRTSPVGIRGSLVTPFPRGQRVNGRVQIEPVRPQHAQFVTTIKQNRARNNLDRISCNRGKVVYECVWTQSDNNGPWMCFYALDIYDWKDLGRTVFGARGCAGFYVLPSGEVPLNASRHIESHIMVPVTDQLDPFGR
jgi:hypothetical protein